MEVIELERECSKLHLNEEGYYGPLALENTRFVYKSSASYYLEA